MVLDSESVVGVTHECPFSRLVLRTFCCQTHVGIVVHIVQVVAAFQNQFVVDDFAALILVEGYERILLHRGSHFNGLVAIDNEINLRIVVEKALVEVGGQLRDGCAIHLGNGLGNQGLTLRVHDDIVNLEQGVVVEIKFHALRDFLCHVELRAVGQGSVRELVVFKRGNFHLTHNAFDFAEVEHFAVGSRECLEVNRVGIVRCQRSLESSRQVGTHFAIAHANGSRIARAVLQAHALRSYFIKAVVGLVRLHEHHVVGRSTLQNGAFVTCDGVVDETFRSRHGVLVGNAKHVLFGNQPVGFSTRCGLRDDGVSLGCTITRVLVEREGRHRVLCVGGSRRGDTHVEHTRVVVGLEVRSRVPFHGRLRPRTCHHRQQQGEKSNDSVHKY